VRDPVPHEGKRWMADTEVRNEGAEPSGTAYLRLVALGALIGIPAALLAAGFLAFVHELEHCCGTSCPSSSGTPRRPGTS
jgi:hypothetical protein